MISKKRATRAAVAGGAVLALVLAGCSSSSTGPKKSTAAPILNVYTGASGAFVENWNPFSPTALSNVKGNMFEAFFFFNNLQPLSKKPIPVLGKDYSWNADGTVLTVHMQDGYKWTDGQPITGADAAFTYNTIKAHPALDTSGNAPSATASGQTVTLTFKKPSYVDGPNILGTPIAPEHIWKNVKDPEKDVNKNPVSSGPLKFGSFSAQSYLLVKNPTFHDAKDVEIGGERFYSLSGNEAGTQKLLAGQLDWSGIFIPDMVKVLATKKNLGYGSSSSAQVVLTTCSSVALGCKGPQTDPQVRHAIAAALDRDQINKLANYGTGTPISDTFALIGRDDAFIAPQFTTPEPMQPDVAKATSILEGAGWKKGSDGIYAKNGTRLSLTASVVTGWTNYIATLDLMKAELKAAGIDLVPVQQSYAQLNTSVGLGKFQLSISSLWQGPAADPYYVYNTFYNSASTRKVGVAANPYTDVARFKSPIVDAALAKAAGTEDPAVKAAAYAEIQKVIVEDMPYIPVLNTVGSSEFSTARVTGFPSVDNQYASSDPGNQVSQAYVVTHLKVVKK